MPRNTAPWRRLAIEAAAIAIVLTVAGCASMTEVGPPVATPTDIIGISQDLRLAGVTIHDVVSGDAGCTDPDLIPTAIAFQASGVDQSAPVPVRLYIFRNDASYQKLRSAVDGCAAAWVTDPATFEAVDVSPYVAAGQGPWAPGFRDALRAGLTVAAGGETEPSSSSAGG